MIGFSDSNYADYVDDKKSTSGYIFIMVEEAILWKSVKLTLIAFFNLEAKYMTCNEATCHEIS